MRRRTKAHLWACLVIVLGGLPPAAQGQGPADGDSIPAEAERRLQEIVGTWDSTWEHLDAEGQVVRTVSGTEVAEWSIDGRVVLMNTRIPELNSTSRAFMFYNQAKEEFTLTSVDQKGDFWVLTGNLDEYIITSQPRKTPDGQDFVLRFTHYEENHNEFTAIMEYKVGDAEEWTKGFRQTLKRRESDG